MNKKQKNLIKWNEWFAGFIDGDASILVYKDHVSIEATTSMDDNGILSDIKKKFGGSLKPRSNAQALRWRSRKKSVILKILDIINGHIYNDIRLEQLKKACNFLNIEFILPISKNLDSENILNNSYLSGLFDADGSISLNINRKRVDNSLNNLSGKYGKIQRLIYSRGYNQCQIKCTNKNKKNIEIFRLLNIGNCFYEKNKQGHEKWHWIIKQDEIPIFLEYIKNNPLRSMKKKHRYHLLPKYFKLKTIQAHIADENSIEFKEWIKFCNEWYKY